MPKVSEVIAELQERFKPDEHIAYGYWTVDDIIETANDEGYEFTEEDAIIVLEKFHTSYIQADCEFNRDAIIECIENYVSFKEQFPDEEEA